MLRTAALDNINSFELSHIQKINHRNVLKQEMISHPQPLDRWISPSTGSVKKILHFFSRK